MGNDRFLVEMRNINKSFPGVQALKDVSLHVRKGTVHALMGENGAGKSTLMKILSGIYGPDSGEIILRGEKIELKNPADALQHGISMIHQELTPISEMTVGENVFLGREPTYAKTRLINYKKLYQQAKDLLKEIDLDLDPRTRMKNLNVAETQLVEIIKALSYDSRVIIMDEPTSAITDHEVEKLFGIIALLKKQGKGIIYISHKMDEIFQISDDITVFRDGKHIATKPANELNNSTLITMMVGRELHEIFPENRGRNIQDTVLSVRGISSGDDFQNISFDLRQGEILGITGLMGSGRTEVVEGLFGIRPLDSGEVHFKGKKLKITQPKDAINHGIAFVTEDRKGQGLFLQLSVLKNISISSLNKLTRQGFLKKKEERKVSSEYISSLNIKAYSATQVTETLSGGNQQKVVFAKWLLTKPDILILDEPTRGIDIGSKAEIYKLIYELSRQGMSIIVISSEMPEVMGISDRIIVLHDGKLAGELEGSDVTQEKILELATGHSIGV